MCNLTDKERRGLVIKRIPRNCDNMGSKFYLLTTTFLVLRQ